MKFVAWLALEPFLGLGEFIIILVAPDLVFIVEGGELRLGMYFHMILLPCYISESRKSEFSLYKPSFSVLTPDYYEKAL